jgi:hypothetical protein
VGRQDAVSLFSTSLGFQPQKLIWLAGSSLKVPARCCVFNDLLGSFGNNYFCRGLESPIAPGTGKHAAYFSEDVVGDHMTISCTRDGPTLRGPMSRGIVFSWLAVKISGKSV